MTDNKVTSKTELLVLIFELMDDNDANEWKNDTAYIFIAAVAEYLDKVDSSVSTTPCHFGECFGQEIFGSKLS